MDQTRQESSVAEPPATAGRALPFDNAMPEQYMRAILDNASVGILFSRARVIEHCNPRMAEILGYRPEDLIGKPGITIYPDEESYRLLGEAAAPKLAAGESYQGELQLRRCDGSLVWCRIYAKAVDAEQTANGTVWIMEDISAQHRDEETLRETLLELYAIMSNAPVAIGFSRDRKIVRYNPRFAEIFGYEGDAGIGRPTLELYPSQAAYDEAGKQAFPLLSQGLSFQAEMEMQRQDGSIFWARAIAYLIDPARPQQGAIWIIDDHSAQKAAAEALDKALLEQQAILDNASLAIVFTRDRRILRGNPRALEMFGYTAEQLIGLPAVELYPSTEAYAEMGAAAAPLLAAGQRFETETEIRRRDGSLFIGRVHGQAVDPTRNEAGTIWIVEDVTEGRREQALLQQTLMEMEAIMINASVGILFTKNRLISRYNHRFAEMFAMQGDEGLGLPGRTLYSSQEIYDQIGAQAFPLLSTGKSFRTEVEMRRQDDSTFWAELIGYVLDPVDTARGTIWIITDRSEPRRAELALRNALFENEAILENALIGIVIAENGCILRCNSKLEEVLAVPPGELTGRPVRSLYPDDAGWQSARAAAAKDFAAGRIHLAEVEMVRRDGSLFWGSISGRLFDPDKPQGRSVWLLDDVTLRKRAESAVLRARDELEQRVKERTAELAAANVKLQEEVADRIRAEQRVQHMAYHDGLTGLPNRALLSDRLSQGMLQAQRGGFRVAVMFIDLDRFKTINDTLGHPVGDSLLKAVATRLETAVRSSDTVARQGGDEFVVVLPELRETVEAELIARKVIASFDSAFMLHNRELRISPSVGICLFPEDGRDVDTLLRNADVAMYHAKASGRNNFQFFTPALNQATTQRFELENLLHQALGNGEFRLYYQPLMDIATRKLASMEVLLRWQQPRLGLVVPDRFIPILEDNGGIVAVGAWVMRQAAEQLVVWQKAGLPVVPLAVNLSPRQFMDHDLAGSIRRILDDTGIDPDLLELEITETGLMQQATQTLEVMQQIRAMGVRLTIDDFGTGYSSLAYLKRFPVSKLKIDRAFIKDSEENADDRAIVAAIIALADSLDLAVVAEGVETEGQFALLAGKRCRYAQGYLFSRPVPAAEAMYFLDPQRVRPKQA
jgi:diguanylate cyclase (GGDEF)-like protein/PAS domain S-box-containing protein